MSADSYQAELIQWLEQHGHPPEEIRQIMSKLAAYDQAMVRDALFSAMHSGSFSLEAILRETGRMPSPPPGQGGAPGRPDA